MAGMPRPRKPYLHKEVTRHGKTVWYFRRSKEKRVRLPGVFGSAEFNAAYVAALAGLPIEEKVKAPKSSLRWLVDRYYESGRFGQLKPSSQNRYRYMLESICKTGGGLDFRAITPGEVRAGKTRREHTPFVAQMYVNVMRAIYGFAVDSNWMEESPVASIKVGNPKTDGFHTWTFDEVVRYQERHPLGTQARLAMDLMLYTGLRVSDAILVGPQHIRDGVITLRTTKTGTDIKIPLLQPLAVSIQATPCGNLVLLQSAREVAWTSSGFSHWFRERCREADVPGRAHGLRKAGATFAADNGATPFELTAMYGWSSTKMAEVYTRKADRSRLAERAANKLFPHPKKGAGDN